MIYILCLVFGLLLGSGMTYWIWLKDAVRYDEKIERLDDRLNERIEQEKEDFDRKPPARSRSKEELELYLDMGRLFGLEETRDIMEGVLKDRNLDVEAPEVWE